MAVGENAGSLAPRFVLAMVPSLRPSRNCSPLTSSSAPPAQISASTPAEDRSPLGPGVCADGRAGARGNATCLIVAVSPPARFAVCPTARPPGRPVNSTPLGLGVAGLPDVPELVHADRKIT